MADNYLERQYDDYLAGKAAKEQARKLKWKKQLKAYQKKLAATACQDKTEANDKL